MNFLKLRMELLKKIKNIETGFSYSLIFKRGVILTTFVSFLLVFTAIILTFANPIFQNLFTIVVAVLFLSQAVFLYFSAVRFYQLLHRNDANATSIQKVDTNMMRSDFSRYLINTIRCMVIIASCLLATIVLQIVFTFFASDPWIFIFLQFLFRTFEFSILVCTLVIMLMRRRANVPSTGKNTENSSQNVSMK
jgi:hypothetical protein